MIFLENDVFLAKNGPDCLENITVRFRNIQMYMNYDGVCLNVEVLKEID